MATLVSRASGDFTAAATWGVADTAAGAILTTLTGSYTNLGTSYSYGTAFTITNGAVITGVLLFLDLRSASPTVTITMALSDDGGTTATREVTVDAADLAASNVNQWGAWTFFKFGTTLTADGGTDYRIGLKISAGSTFQIGAWYATAQPNWSHIIVTNTTAAPAAADTLFVVGELTGQGASSSFAVRMDNANTTAFGAITVGFHGSVAFATDMTTNLRLAGILTIQAPDAIFAIGTPGGTVIPRTYTATLEFDCGSHGQYGVHLLRGAFKSAGESRTSGKNVVQCKLNTDEAAGATTLGVDTDTGWLSGDEIVIATTTTAHAETEARTLTGNAGASSLDVAALTYAHQGTSPIQAEIIHLTRNVRVTVTSTFATYIRNPSLGTVECAWTDFNRIGTATTGKRGFDGDDGAGAGYGGTFTLTYCTLRNSNDSFIRLSQPSNVLTVTDCVTYLAVGTAFYFTGTTWTGTITRTTILKSGTNNSGFGVYALNPLLSFVDVTIAAHNNYGFMVDSAQGMPDISGLTVHSTAAGLAADFISLLKPVWKTISNTKFWRNTTNGLRLGMGVQRLIFANSQIFGNVTDNIVITTDSATAAAPGMSDVVFRNVVVAGSVGQASGTGLRLSIGSCRNVIFQNCTFGVVSGAFTAHTSRDVTPNNDEGIILEVHFNNCLFASATPFTELFGAAGQSGSIFTFQDYQQVAGANQAWLSGSGKRIRNTTVVNTGQQWSEELSLVAITGVTIRYFASAPRHLEVQSGSSKTVSVAVRKSASFAGDAPKLILRANPSMGVDDDTVIDTMTVGADTWETLTGTLPTPTNDGVYELIVEVVGSAGSVYVDQGWAVS